MNKKITIGYLGVLLLLICLKALAVDSVGAVIAVRGKVYAITTTGEKRELYRKGAFYLHEIIETSDNGSVQLRLKDNTLVSLRANTKYSVKEFNFDAAKPNASSYVGKLTEGVLISLSSPGQNATFANHQLQTPMATIAIRGTLYEAGVSYNKKNNNNEVVGTGWVHTYSGKVSVTSGNQTKILNGNNKNTNACIYTAIGTLNQQNEFVPTAGKEIALEQISTKEISQRIGGNVEGLALEVTSLENPVSSTQTITTTTPTALSQPVQPITMETQKIFTTITTSRDSNNENKGHGKEDNKGKGKGRSKH